MCSFISLLQEWSLLDDFVSLQSCQDIIAWACAGDPNLMEGEACVIAWFLGWCILNGCWHGSYLSSVLPLQFSIFQAFGPLRDPWSSICGYMVRQIMHIFRKQVQRYKKVVMVRVQFWSQRDMVKCEWHIINNKIVS